MKKNSLTISWSDISSSSILMIGCWVIGGVAACIGELFTKIRLLALLLPRNNPPDSPDIFRWCYKSNCNVLIFAMCSVKIKRKITYDLKIWCTILFSILTIASCLFTFTCYALSWKDNVREIGFCSRSIWFIIAMNAYWTKSH